MIQELLSISGSQIPLSVIGAQSWHIWTNLVPLGYLTSLRGVWLTSTPLVANEAWAICQTI